MDIVESYRNLVKGQGCSDGSCCFEKPKGMHTNGGCSCDSKRTSHEIKLRKLGQVGRYAQEMADTIEKLRAENKELRAASEWRSIETSLPDLLTPVFLLDTGSIWNAPDEIGEVLEMTQGYLNDVRGHKYWSIFGARGAEINSYTHWLPLPKAPEVE